MLKYWVWLSELKGLRNQTKLALLRRFGDPESIFYADPDELMLTEVQIICGRIRLSQSESVDLRYHSCHDIHLKSVRNLYW